MLEMLTAALLLLLLRLDDRELWNGDRRELQLLDGQLLHGDLHLRTAGILLLVAALSLGSAHGLRLFARVRLVLRLQEDISERLMGAA